jgi:uncharacterized protein (DUF1697 family)
MPRHIAFLRAINVGGHTVTMDRLRELFGELGLKDVETFIASGNVIFRSPAKAPGLEAKIERHLHQALGYEVHTFIRSEGEVAAIAGYKPFRTVPADFAGAMVVGFLRGPLDSPTTKAVLALKTAIDDLQVNGREIYWRTAGGQSDSKLTNALFERTLKGRATFRNINTVVRLAARYPAKGT